MYDPQGIASSGLQVWLGWLVAQSRQFPFPGGADTQWQKGLHRQFEQFIRGLHTYQTAPQPIDREMPPVVWQQGSTKLYDYGIYGDAAGQSVLVIPSLINRSYIFDLSEQQSLLRFWAQQGLRPFLVDWGELGPFERDFGLEAYYQDRLVPMLQFLQSATNQPVSLVGYCMGGLLATAMAAQYPQVARLVLLSTPWDFHRGREWLALMMQNSSPFLESLIEIYQELPAEAIQMMFAALNPPGVVQKFMELGQQVQDQEYVRGFADVQDWLNDCVPLAPKVAKECLLGWYRDNLPFQQQWMIQGRPILPQEIQVPTLGVIAQEDIIVPPASSQALMDTLANAETLHSQSGHIGIITSRTAREQIWEPVAEFLKT